MDAIRARIRHMAFQQDGPWLLPSTPLDTQSVPVELLKAAFLLGQHVHHWPPFQLAEYPTLGAAKGCGHGNHDGPRRGAVHWERVVARYSLSAARDLVGI